MTPVRQPEMAVRFGPVTARDRDVELGVAPHAVLGHVETCRLDLRLDADAPQLLHHPQRPKRGRERESTDGYQAERLHAELVERAAVDEPRRARGEVLREHGD